MDDSTVVACLMACDCRFFLDDCQGNSAKTAGEFKACCQANNASPDNYNFDLRGDGDFLTVLQAIVELPEPNNV